MRDVALMRITICRPSAPRIPVAEGGELLRRAPYDLPKTHRQEVHHAPSHPIARPALCTVMLAAGHAASSAAHQSAKPKVRDSFRDDGQRVGVVIARGTASCATARKVLRTYFHSDAPCGG